MFWLEGRAERQKLLGVFNLEFPAGSRAFSPGSPGRPRSECSGRVRPRGPGRGARNSWEFFHRGFLPGSGVSEDQPLGRHGFAWAGTSQGEPSAARVAPGLGRAHRARVAPLPGGAASAVLAEALPQVPEAQAAAGGCNDPRDLDLPPLWAQVRSTQTRLARIRRARHHRHRQHPEHPGDHDPSPRHRRDLRDAHHHQRHQ